MRALGIRVNILKFSLNGLTLTFIRWPRYSLFVILRSRNNVTGRNARDQLASTVSHLIQGSIGEYNAVPVLTTSSVFSTTPLTSTSTDPVLHQSGPSLAYLHRDVFSSILTTSWLSQLTNFLAWTVVPESTPIFPIDCEL